MKSSSLKFNTASACIGVGIVLVLINWYARPENALAWTAALAMFGVMIVALRLSRSAARGVSGIVASAGSRDDDHAAGAEPTSAHRTPDRIAGAVILASIMMGVPLALTVARSYGLAVDDELPRRAVGVLIGLMIVVMGNAMPKNLPPLSGGYDYTRQREFQRSAGRTWMVCGLTSALGWMALPIDYGATATVVPVVIAMALMVVYLVRIARRPKITPPVG